jgi:hypothetical protein
LGFPIAGSIGLRGTLRPHSSHPGAAVGALQVATMFLRLLLHNRAALAAENL